MPVIKYKKIPGKIKKIIFWVILLSISYPLSAVHQNRTYRSVVLGIETSSPPYELIDNNGNASGFSVEIASALAEELGWRIKFIHGSRTDLNKFLDNGEIDLIPCTDLSMAKNSNHSYSEPYHEFHYSVFINSSDMPLFRETGFSNLIPVVTKGGYISEYVLKNKPDKQPVEVDNLLEVISYIASNKNYFGIINKFQGLYLSRYYGIDNIEPAGVPLQRGVYVFEATAQKRNLIADINEGLRIIRINGRYDRIYGKWFNILSDTNNRSGMSKLYLFFLLPLAVFLLTALGVRFFCRFKTGNKIEELNRELNISKLTEKTLHENEARTRLIIENAPVGIFHFDDKGVITICNDNCLSIFGTSKEKIIGHNLLENHNYSFVERIRSVLNGSPDYYEGQYSSVTSGKTTLIRSMLTPLKLNDGTIKGGLGIVEDNTERKEYEKAILSAKDTAESANSIKSDFLANMSHEVRTPLNGILGMLQLLQTTEINEEQSNYISVAIKSGVRLTRLLNDILDLSRVESEKLLLSESKFRMNEIIDYIKERYEPECRDKHVELSISVKEGTPDEIIGDETRIRQIMLNLISNAVKFTKQGRITVSIGIEELSSYNSVNLAITVEDTGIGIPPDIQNHIFEPFRQGENSYRRTFQGAGLGLTLVKHLVQLMNGTIKINSTPGEGTKIECKVMAKLPDNRPARVKPPHMREDGEMITVLIAEDERINRLALKRILEKAGYKVLEAENGIESLNILEKTIPDCILMDIQMPKMDGIEATKIIREREKNGIIPAMPVIALTAYTMPEDRERIDAAGFNDYISKPLNMENLLKSVSRFTGTGKQ